MIEIKHNKRIKYFGSIVFVFFVIVMIVWCIQKKTDKNEQWALKNTGQIVNEIKGVPNVDIGIDNLDKKYKRGENILVGIIDTGIYVDEGYLNQYIYNNENERINDLDDDNNGYVDDVNGWNFYDDNNQIYSDSLSDYHGTMITNIISGNDSDYSGVAPEAKILPMKCFSGNEGDLEDIEKAILYACDLGVDLINVSWDSEVNDKKLFDIIRNNSDTIFVCSSGNRANDLEQTPVYPAGYELDNVIAVSGITSSGELYKYSGIGERIDIVAPAENILCVLPENDKMFHDGTSLATAYVTGGIAILLSNYPNLSPADVKEILKKSSVDIDGRGIGYLDIEESLKMARNWKTEEEN